MKNSILLLHFTHIALIFHFRLLLGVIIHLSPLVRYKHKENIKKHNKTYGIHTYLKGKKKNTLKTSSIDYILVIKHPTYTLDMIYKA